MLFTCTLSHAQAPAYHIALEAVLVTWIVYLLFFSKQYRPESKHDKPSKEASPANMRWWALNRDACN